ALVAAVIVAPVAKAAKGPIDRLFPNAPSGGQGDRMRLLEIYRAQLEVALVDGRITEREAAVLADARRRFGITDEEHGRLVSHFAG
ncbi:MAG: hypothetical protein ACT4PT_06395, partial [Methanobacteriota archaeon]